MFKASISPRRSSVSVAVPYGALSSDESTCGRDCQGNGRRLGGPFRIPWRVPAASIEGKGTSSLRLMANLTAPNDKAKRKN